MNRAECLNLRFGLDAIWACRYTTPMRAARLALRRPDGGGTLSRCNSRHNPIVDALFRFVKTVALSKSDVGLLCGALAGAGVGIWVWWAAQIPWWAGVLIAMTLAILSRVWLEFQVRSDRARPIRRIAPFAIASWICLITPLIVFLIFLADTPNTLPPPNEREAASMRAFRFVYPDFAAIPFGAVSLWGMRGWKPIWLLLRSVAGIGLACAVAYMIAMAAVGMNLWN
jgi:hypothetical protein